MPDRRGANRLSLLDDMYFQGSRFGVHMKNQWIWRFDQEFPLEQARQLHARLQAGPLSRLVVRSSVPGARSRWVPAPPVEPLHVSHEPVTDEMAWANDWSDAHLDLVRGPSWVMAWAPRAAGGTLVMINASHAITDGRMLFKAVIAAVEGEPVGILPDDSWDAAQVRRRDDVRDAARQFRAAARAARTAAQLWRSGELQRSMTEGRQPARSGQQPPPLDKKQLRIDSRLAHEEYARTGRPYRAPLLSFTIPARDFHDAAESRGGRANTLFLALSVGILEQMDRVGEGEILKISTPVDGATPDTEMRSNNTHGVTLSVEVRADRYRDLTPIRAEAKRRYAGLADGSLPNHMVTMRPIMQLVPDLLPDSLIGRAMTGSPSAICTNSNLGHLDDRFAGLGGVPASSVISRGVLNGISRPDAAATRGGLSLWMNQSGDTITISAWAMDPDAVPDDATWRRFLTTEVERWGLTPTFW